MSTMLSPFLLLRDEQKLHLTGPNRDNVFDLPTKTQMVGVFYVVRIKLICVHIATENNYTVIWCN